jgi:hypothetical protein
MEDIRIILSGLWIATMLTYLLGDVIRIFSGEIVFGEIEGVKVSQIVWLGIAAFMLVPILMLYLSLTWSYPLIRWGNIIVPIILIGFNLVSLASYSLFDQFLLIVSMVFNLMTIWQAWKWVLT